MGQLQHVFPKCNNQNCGLVKLQAFKAVRVVTLSDGLKINPDSPAKVTFKINGGTYKWYRSVNTPNPAVKGRNNNFECAVKNDVGKLHGMESGAAPYRICHCIFYQDVGFDDHFGKISARKITDFDIAS